jgi:hypothetical protein
MGISKSEASLRAVRLDLDLPAAGSIKERPVLNRVNKQSAPIGLGEHKGVAWGLQLDFRGNPNDPPTNRSYGYSGFYPTQSGFPRLSGNTIICSAAHKGDPDGSCEYRSPFWVSESGTYRISGNLSYQPDTNQNLGSWQVAIVSSGTGYLSGSVVYDLIKSGSDPGSRSFSYDVPLTTSRRYATAILYALRKGGGYAEYPVTSTATWSNVRVVQI